MSRSPSAGAATNGGIHVTRFPVFIVAVVLSLACASVTLAQEKPAGGDAKKFKIAGVIFQEDQFFRLLSFGMKDAADAAGAEFFLGNSKNRPETELQLIDSYIARKVDAIVISPVSSKSSAAALNRAAQRGVKLILTNSTIPGEGPASFIESDQKELGTKTGEAARKYIEEKLGGKANIGILAYKSLLAEQSDARVNGFKEQVTTLPGVKIVTEQDAWLPEAAVKKAGDILTAHPELDILYAANEGGTVGSVLATKNAGKAGKVVVFGTDVSQQLLDFLLSDDNILQAITAQQPYEIGTAGVETAVKVLKGEPVEKKVTLGGISFRRDDKEGIAKFRERLNALIAREEKK
jgi:sugar transport system substrate-binding protein